MDSYVVSKRLGVHPSDVRSAVEGWHERLPAATLGRRSIRVGSRFWLAANPHKASSDPLELYRVRGLLWLFGRPIRVMLEFSVWSDTVSEVALRPANLAWPVCTERYGRRAARVLEDVVASVTSQRAPLVAHPRGATPRLVSGFRPLRGLSPSSTRLDPVPSPVQALLVGSNVNGGSQARTAQSKTTGRNWFRGSAKHWWLLTTLAALAVLTTVQVVSPGDRAPRMAESVATSTRGMPASLRAAGEGSRYRLITRLGRLSVLRSPEERGRSTSHAEQDVRNVCAMGTHVFLVKTPIDRSSAAGTDRGSTSSTLPCTSIEQSCGANGTILVSSPDGIHFCPGGTPSNQGVTGPCDENSTGALRFVLTTVAAVTQCPQPAPALLV